MSIPVLDQLITDLAISNNSSRSSLDQAGIIQAALKSLFDSASKADIEDALNAAHEHQESVWSELEQRQEDDIQFAASQARKVA